MALSWAADGGVFYDILSTTNLTGGAWGNLTADAPVAATNLVGTLSLLSSNTAVFFRVRPVDTQGPTITARYPGENAVGVGRSNALTVVVVDASGIDTNSLRLTVNGGAALANGEVGVTVTTNSFQYNPAAAGTSWGAFGTTVTVTFACLDLNGNATSAEWSFCLEVPVTLNENIMVLGGAAQQAGVGIAAGAIAPLATELEIVSIYPDRIVLSYTGASHGVTVGMLFANGDFDNLFYRRATGMVDNPSTHQVTVYTVDIPLTELITGGSFESGDFVWSDGGGGGGLSAMGVVPLATFSNRVQFSKSDSFSVNTDWGAVSFAGTAGYSLSGGLSFSTEINNLKITQISAGVDANLDVALDAQLVFDATTEPVDESIGLLGDGIRLGQATAWVYGIPVRVSLWLDMALGVESGSSGAITLDASASANAKFSYNIGYSRATQWTKTSDGNFTYALPPVVISGGMEGHAYVYVMPTLTVRLYEAVGIELEYLRGPYVTGQVLVGDGRYQFGLYDKRSVNRGIWMNDLPDFLDGLIDTENLPSWELWSAEAPVLNWYWPELSELSAPAFTLHPASGTAAAGTWVTLSASASGNPAPTYQWYQNGVLLNGKTGATIGFTMGSQSVGTYHCRASNSRGAANSQSATLSLPATAPAGMALIPAGSFQMGDNLGDGESTEVPMHTVYVSAFHMDKTEVTWGKWKEVRTYAAANGYDIGSVGGGKADNHPVHSVNWYDCVKWLNARSQMEGLSPCYRRGGAVYKAEQHDDIVCDWSAGGYRLPTEAEWEKAARGGLSGKRFPWGDTINHGRANYYAAPWDWYDTNGYEGYHPSYMSGGYPYTSPVGSFAANGYGLYDMSGNLWEWCWDWFDGYSSGSVSNPRGPSSPSGYWGAGRVDRGGGWRGLASYCRSADRNPNSPAPATSSLAFGLSCPQVSSELMQAGSFEPCPAERG